MMSSIFKILLLLFSVFSLSCGEKLSNGQDVAKFVDEKIKGSDVVVFAKKFCPYCQKTVGLFQKLYDGSDNSWTLEIIQLNSLPEDDGPRVQMEILTRTGQRTVPNVFMFGTHIGGSAQVEELHSGGKLREMLARASHPVE